MVQSTEATWTMASARALACKFGLTAQGTKANGIIIAPMVKENSGIQTVIFMTENGVMTKLMDMVSTGI